MKFSSMTTGLSSILAMMLLVMTALPTAIMAHSGGVGGGDDVFYKTTVRTRQDCSDTSSSGTVVVIVKNSAGRPMKKKHVDFLLVADSGNTYTRNTRTNRNGKAAFTFDIQPEDEGENLWCSIAVDNPNLPNAQQVSCSIVVDCP